MRSPDRSCRYYIQDVFFWHLAGPVAPTGKAIVHWIGCINAIKCDFMAPVGQNRGQGKKLSFFLEALHMVSCVFLINFKAISVTNKETIEGSD